VILVVKSGAARRTVLRRGRKMLEDVQARIIGAVLNQVDTRKSSYYAPYHYYHYYGEEKAGGKARTSAGAKG
jgi:Mrp family chromosome partitioning ATPase